MFHRGFTPEKIANLGYIRALSIQLLFCFRLFRVKLLFGLVLNLTRVNKSAYILANSDKKVKIQLRHIIHFSQNFLRQAKISKQKTPRREFF